MTQADVGGRGPLPVRADRIGLVVLGWHALLVAGYLVLLALLPEGRDACAGYLGQCLGPRAGAALLGGFVGAPAVLVSLVLAAVVAHRLARDPRRSAVRVGTLAAWAALAVTASGVLLVGLMVGLLTAT